MAAAERKRIDLTGQTFSRLTVIDEGPPTRSPGGKPRRAWNCRCSCGNTVTIGQTLLRMGHTKSCGCLRNESYSTTHGLSHTPTYNSWKGMHARCSNEAHPAYANYGGRGIKVCERWATFAIFLADMGVAPKGCSIERRDNHGDYSPDNCEWATRIEQNNNRRSSHLISFDGKTQSIAMWARELGIHVRTLNTRLNDLGWSVEQALTQSIRPRSS